MKGAEIWGQWIGNFAGPEPGLALLNVEAGRSNSPFVCMVQGTIATRAVLSVEFGEDTFRAKSERVLAFDPSTNNLVSAEEFCRITEGKFFLAGKIEMEGTYSTHSFKGQWRSDTAGGGDFSLSNPATQLVEQPDQICTWSDFIALVEGQKKNAANLIYRGQASNSWRLRTSFHRQKRYDLTRYWNEVCPALQARFKNAGINFDLKNPEDIGSLICFAQHHGFPTPLLDWTSNPYVAAYFAFERGPNVFSPNQCCRIYLFDPSEWAKDSNNGASLTDPNPLVSLRTFDSKHIVRQRLQSCLHTFSNVEDLEAWIRLVGSKNQKRYLTTIDIPWNQRRAAKGDLAKLGCTAEKLFDGHDAMCKTLTEEIFQ